MEKLSLIGLDYGAATVGVAASDGLFLTAQPLEVIRRDREKMLRETYRRIAEICEERKANAIIVGYPKHLSGDIGSRAQASEEFAQALARRTGLKVILWDERYTTVSAHRILDEAELDYKKKAEVVDKLAAVLILQSFMDYLENKPEEKTALLEEIYGREG